MSLAVSNNSALAAGAVTAPALYSQLEKFHGHVCAGSIFGARLGLAAKDALKVVGNSRPALARHPPPAYALNEK